MDLALGCQRAGEEHHRLDRQPDARTLDADPHRHDEIDERRPDIAQYGKGVADELLHSRAPLGGRQCPPLGTRQSTAAPRPHSTTTDRLRLPPRFLSGPPTTTHK